MARILIVEDEYPINNLISKNLTLTGHECLSAYDGLNAIELIRSVSLDLVILDVMLPGLSGFDLIKLIGNVPVIFLTAKSGLEDRLKGLSLGADDYIVKPFSMQELLARVSVVLRRTKRDETTISFDGLTVDMGSRKVYRGEEKINLTPKEYALLEVLITNRNLALSREKLISMVWTYDYEGDTRTVDVHIKRLREKLEGVSDNWSLKTVWGVGYKFETKV